MSALRWLRARCAHALRSRAAIAAVVVAGGCGVAVAAGLNAHASTPVSITIDGTSLSADTVLHNATYANAKSALSTATSLNLPLGINDLTSLHITPPAAPAEEVSTDDTNNSLVIAGTVTIKGQGVQMQLSAVWPSSSSTTPQIALAIQPTAGSLSSLNALWSGAPVDPTLTSALVLASPTAGYTFDPTLLPSSAQGFYPTGMGTLAVGQGLSLYATVDASTDPTLSKALQYLGEGTSVTISGTLSTSIADVLGSATSAQESGLDLKISDTAVGASLPSWMTSRDSSIELQIGTGGVAVQVTDTIGTTINGHVNTFTGTATYGSPGFSGSTFSISYGLAPPQTTLDAPYDFGSLSLSNPTLQLSLTSGSPPTFAASLNVDATVDTVIMHVSAAITAGGGEGATLQLTGALTTANVVDFANGLLGTTVDASSLGDAITLTGVSFSFAKDTTAHTEELDLNASATLRSTLNASVLVSIKHTDGSTPQLIVGLQLTDPSCNCIKMSDILGNTLSSLTSGLQFPAVDVMGSTGFGATAGHPASVSTSGLPAAVKTFLGNVYATLPSTINLQQGLSLTGKITVPASITSALGMQSGSQVLLTGDVGVKLGSFSGPTTPSLTGTLTATLPAMTVPLPSWLSGEAGVTWTASLSADSSKTVQLAVHADGTLSATLNSTQYTASITGDLTTGTGGTTVSLTGGITGTFTNLFGINWLSLSNPTVALALDTTKSPLAFTASLDGTVTLGSSLAVDVTANITSAGGTDASVEAKVVGPVSLNTVITDFNADISGLANMPAVTISSMDARFAAGSSGLSFDLSATTTLTTQTSKSISATLLLSVSHKNNTTNLLAGFAATPSSGDVTLSDFIPAASLPEGTDFTFPSFAVVLAHPAQTLDYTTESPDLQAFFANFCGSADSPCNSQLKLNDGLTIVSSINIPKSLASLVDQVHSDSNAALLVTGSIPVFGGDLSTLSLKVSLPAIQVTDPKTPDFLQGGSLSLDVTAQSIGLDGVVTFNVPKNNVAQADCAGLGGVWRAARNTTTYACYDQVPFELTANMALLPVPSMTLTGGLQQGAVWTAPLGAKWLALQNATIQFGIEVPPAGPTFSLGFDIGFTITANNTQYDFFGSILASLTVTPEAPWLEPDLVGFRVESQHGLGLSDLVSLGSAITGKTLPAISGVPDVSVRKIDFGYSEIDDPALCLNQGIHIAGDVYINPAAGAGNTAYGWGSGPNASAPPPAGGCPTATTAETNRTADCQADASNGCFASADLSIDDNGIHASGSLGAFDVGPIHFGAAQLDIEATKTVQHLLVSGSMTINGFASGSVDLLVTDSNLHFRGSADILGSAFHAYLDGSATYALKDLGSLKNGASFSINAVLQSDFLNQAGVAISGTLDQLKPVVAALDVVLGDVSKGNLLDAAVDLPIQLSNLGVSLPDPLGSSLSDLGKGLNGVKGFLDAIGQSLSSSLNDILNGYDISVGGQPGSVYPSEPTCDAAVIDGTCIGVTAYPHCYVAYGDDGNCYAVLPTTIHVPGLCTFYKPSAIVNSNGDCDINLVVPNLIDPALAYAFKAITGYDLGNNNLSSIFNSISNAIGSGNLFSINCAEFGASATISSSPSASVTLAANIGLFGKTYNYGVGWNFGTGTDSGASAALDIIKSIITPPSTNVTCALPADWGTNKDFPSTFTGQAPGSNGPPPPPVMTLTPASSSINEGDAATVNGTITPAPGDGTTVSVAWGDGSSPTSVTTSGGAFSADHTYANNTPVGQAVAQYVVSATEGTLVQTTDLAVANVAPQILSLYAPLAKEGSPAALDGTISDPGTVDTHVVAINWGDGKSSTVSLAAGVLSFSAAHTYLDNAPSTAGYTAGVTVTDDDHASSSVVTTAVQVANVAPSQVTITPTSCVVAAGAVPCTALRVAQEGALVTYDVSFTDPGVLDTASAVVDWGDGTSATVPVAINAPDAQTGARSATRTFSVQHAWREADTAGHVGSPPPGKFTVAATVTDKDGGVGKGTTIETVENVVPYALTTSLSSAKINEGDPPVTLSGSLLDQSAADTHSVLVDWGDGTPATTVPLAVGVEKFKATHSYLDNPASGKTFAVKTTVTDDDGASTLATIPIEVDNVAPSAVTLTPVSCVVPTGPVPCASAADAQENALVTFTGTFIDPGVLDTATAVITWADGTTPTTVSVPISPVDSQTGLPSAKRTFTVSHTWMESDAAGHSTSMAPPAGKFTVGVTVTDKDLGVGQGSTVETVENVVPYGLTETLSKTTINELDPAVTVSGTFTDPSKGDTHTVTVDWGSGWGSARYQSIPLAVGVFSYSTSRQFGDDGAYPIAVTVTDDDSASVSTSQTLTVLNVNPNALIDRSAATTIRGTPTFLTHAGRSLAMSGQVTDPGSDDETVLWNWADGTSTSMPFLNAPPNPDPLLSPQVNPVSVTPTTAHTWQNACLYTPQMKATDDDGGVGTDTTTVIITGNAVKAWSDGDWKHVYTSNDTHGDHVLSPATQACYLAIARDVSTVLGTSVPFSTGANVASAIEAHSGNPDRDHLLKEIAVDWLNFANGLYDWTTPVARDDHSPTVPFNVAMGNAEQLFLSPTSTKQQIHDATELLDHLDAG